MLRMVGVGNPIPWALAQIREKNGAWGIAEPPKFTNDRAPEANVCSNGPR
jgi:hypothetical protein